MALDILQIEKGSLCYRLIKKFGVKVVQSVCDSMSGEICTGEQFTKRCEKIKRDEETNN
jgi:hypothetical protein